MRWSRATIAENQSGKEVEIYKGTYSARGGYNNNMAEGIALDINMA